MQFLMKIWRSRKKTTLKTFFFLSCKVATLYSCSFANVFAIREWRAWREEHLSSSMHIDHFVGLQFLMGTSPSGIDNIDVKNIVFLSRKLVQFFSLSGFDKDSAVRVARMRRERHLCLETGILAISSVLNFWCKLDGAKKTILAWSTFVSCLGHRRFCVSATLYSEEITTVWTATLGTHRRQKTKKCHFQTHDGHSANYVCREGRLRYLV